MAKTEAKSTGTQSVKKYLSDLRIVVAWKEKENLKKNANKTKNKTKANENDKKDNDITTPSSNNKVDIDEEKIADLNNNNYSTRTSRREKKMDVKKM